MDAAALASAFAAHRALLFRLCYRMTGSASDADESVQETFAHALAKPPPAAMRDLAPWLVRIALDRSRDHLGRRKRAPYVGPWLPSPLETGVERDERRPDARYGALESIGFAFLRALEALDPRERAVLLLRDVLVYPGAETAAALGSAETDIDTVYQAARAAMAPYDRDRTPITPELQARTGHALAQFLLHLRARDAAALEGLLAADVRALNDSNGEFFAARTPITGPARVARFHLRVARDDPARFAIRTLNGLPALVAEYEQPRRGEATRAVLRIEIDADARIRELHTIVARPKLSHIAFDGL